jgi:hypothetical protein
MEYRRDIREKRGARPIDEDALSFILKIFRLPTERWPLIPNSSRTSKSGLYLDLVARACCQRFHFRG